MRSSRSKSSSSSGGRDGGGMPVPSAGGAIVGHGAHPVQAAHQRPARAASQSPRAGRAIRRRDSARRGLGHAGDALEDVVGEALGAGQHRLEVHELEHGLGERRPTGQPQRQPAPEHVHGQIGVVAQQGDGRVPGRRRRTRGRCGGHGAQQRLGSEAMPLDGRRAAQGQAQGPEGARRVDCALAAAGDLHRRVLDGHRPGGPVLADEQLPTDGAVERAHPRPEQAPGADLGGGKHVVEHAKQRPRAAVVQGRQRPVELCRGAHRPVPDDPSEVAEFRSWMSSSISMGSGPLRTLRSMA